MPKSDPEGLVIEIRYKFGDTSGWLAHDLSTERFLLHRGDKCALVGDIARSLMERILVSALINRIIDNE